MIFCDNKDFKIETDVEPCIRARAILPNMSKEERKDIQKKPFICTRNVSFFIIDKRNNQEYRILIPKGFTSDIASIPIGFRWLFGGKSNPYFICPAVLHDIICIKPVVVAFNRNLASLIFYEMLVACGYNKIKAKIMYFAVEQFQKLQPKWKK